MLAATTADAEPNAVLYQLQEKVVQSSSSKKFSSQMYHRWVFSLPQMYHRRVFPFHQRVKGEGAPWETWGAFTILTALP